MVLSPCNPRNSQKSSQTPQFKSINSLRPAFFEVQLSHPCMTTGQTIALMRPTFVGKVMSLLFNMLSRLVITFLPGSKCLLISWLQSPPAVILEPQKYKVCHYFNFFTLLFHQEAFQFYFGFCHKGGVICVSEVIDTSPGNLDSSLCFIQPGISHDVLYIEVK